MSIPKNKPITKQLITIIIIVQLHDLIYLFEVLVMVTDPYN